MTRRPRLGHRFQPNEVELMIYLKRKVMQKKLPTGDISELDIYRYAPSDLPNKSGRRKGDQNCYFFCPRPRKYGCGTKTERKTEFGTWKSTGQDKNVVHNNEVVGKRKILTFSASKGEQTSWVMHEYRIAGNNLNGVLDAYVLCEIFEKGGRAPWNDSYEEKDYDWDDDVPEEVDCASGLSGPPSKDPHNSSASCILETLPSTSKEIPRIASGSSIAPVETPHSPENFDDGLTMEELLSDNGDEFQATVPADDIYGSLEDQPDWSDQVYQDMKSYNTGDLVMYNFNEPFLEQYNFNEPFLEQKDLDDPLSLTWEDLGWLPEL